MKSPLSAPALQEAGPSRFGDEPRVLLIEADETRGYEIVESLSQTPEAYEVDQCTDVRASVVHLTSRAYDIVVFDAQSVTARAAVAVMDLLRREAPALPIVVVTNHATEEWAASVIQAGATQVCFSRPLSRVSVGREVQVALERHRRQGELRSRAERDPLTGLANRKVLRRDLEFALLSAQRIRRRVALIYVDLDGFKLINDQYGHDAGDEALRRVAQRLRSCVAEVGLPSRMGGDEFAVLLPEVDHLSQPLGIAERICHFVSAPIVWDDVTLTVGCRAGIALYPTSARTPEALLEAADQAMYAAKASRAPVHVHLPGGLAQYHITNQPSLIQ